MGKPLFWQEGATISLERIWGQHPGGRWRVDWIRPSGSRGTAIYYVKGHGAVSVQTADEGYEVLWERRFWADWLLGILQGGGVITKVTTPRK